MWPVRADGQLQRWHPALIFPGKKVSSLSTNKRSSNEARVFVTQNGLLSSDGFLCSLMGLRRLVHFDLNRHTVLGMVWLNR